jgi:alpha-ketoglutarate-dependent taurine dioxygenase
MSPFVQEAGPGIGLCNFPDFWPECADKLAAIIDEFYGADHDAADIAPCAKAQVLQEAIGQAEPRLLEFAAVVNEHYARGYSTLLFERGRLDGFELNKKRKLLYSLSLVLGKPTGTDQVHKRVMWDIRDRQDSLEYAATFSENSEEATLHTDGQYLPYPQKYLMLYFVRAAACGGGVSTLFDGREVKERLARTERGRWAVEVLSSHKAPFRTPAAFTTTASDDAIEGVCAPIFSEAPYIRYRGDMIDKGLKSFPKYNTPEFCEALTIFRSVIYDESLQFKLVVPDDGLLLADNHATLHGRTGFQDRERHVIRIRIDENNPKPSPAASEQLVA